MASLRDRTLDSEPPPAHTLYETFSARVLGAGRFLEQAGEQDPLALENDVDAAEDERQPRPVPVADEEADLADLEAFTGEDVVALYLREMSVIPLLTAAEEVELARRIERGKQAWLELNQMHSSGPVAGGQKHHEPAERRQLEALCQEGELARDHLIRANTRLVVSIARRYLNRGLPLLDLIQEGNLGLMRAVEKYEYQRGFRFSTYATWWIRQAVSRAVADQGRTIRIPVHMIDQLRQVYKTGQEMEQELGRCPTCRELAEQLHVETARLGWLLQLAQQPLSLESTLGDEDDTELGMVVEDQSSPSPVQAANQDMLHECIEDLLAGLPPREARILRMRFGLGHERAYTLEEVGQKFGLTRERIRQLESAALRRLRQPRQAVRLRDYL